MTPAGGQRCPGRNEPGPVSGPGSPTGAGGPSRPTRCRPELLYSSGTRIPLVHARLIGEPSGHKCFPATIARGDQQSPQSGQQVVVTATLALASAAACSSLPFDLAVVLLSTLTARRASGGLPTREQAATSLIVTAELLGDHRPARWRCAGWPGWVSCWR